MKYSKQKKYSACLIFTLLFFISVISIKGQSFSTSISFTPQNPCSGEEVFFTAETEGGTPPFIYAWNFNDPSSPTNIDSTATPSHFFHPLGCDTKIYSISLVVTDTTGGQNIQASSTTQVPVKRRPDPSLFENLNYPQFSNCYNSPPPTPSNPEFTINVSNNTNNTSCIVSDSYSIDWGDGSLPWTGISSSEFPIEYTYTDLGAFNLTFSCQGTNGCIGETVYLVKNESNPAIGLGTSGSTEGCAPITFAFSLDMNKVILNSEHTMYYWYFGDGGTATWNQETAISENGIIEHEYTESSCPVSGSGEFTVIVSADNSCSNTDASVNGVIVWANADVLIDTTVGGCVGEPVMLSNFSTSGWGPGCENTSTYFWDFGNGNTFSGFYPPPQIYNEPGIYNIVLSGSGYCGTSSFTFPIVIDEPPTAAGIASPTAGCVADSLVVTFTNQSAGENLEYLWTVEPETGYAFINNTDSSSTSPIIFFNDNGLFEVILKTFNHCDEDTKVFTIHANDAPEAEFAQEIITTCDSPFIYQASPEIIIYNDHGDEITSYQWYFPGATPNQSTESFPINIVYANSGSFLITLIIENGCGVDTTEQQIEIVSQIDPTIPSDTAICLNSAAFELQVYPEIGVWSGEIVSENGLVTPSVIGSFYLTYSGECLITDSLLVSVYPLPVVNIENYDTGVCVSSEPISLNALPPGGYWQGAGIINPESGIFNPQESGPGQFQISYFYTDTFPGCSCTSSDNLQIVVDSDPLAQFLPEDNIFCTEIENVFLNNTSGGNSNLIFWEFSDGFTSNDPYQVSHSFLEAGNYTIKLTAQSLYGCIDSITRQIEVIEKPPDPFFSLSFSPENLCSPVDATISFDPSVYDEYVTYFWDFGNGTNLISNSSFTDTTITFLKGVADSTYYLNLSVINQCGTLTYTDSVSVYSNPVARFGQDYNWNCSPVPINFINKCLGAVDSIIWNFGDGSDTILYNPQPEDILSHSFYTNIHDTTYTTKIITYNNCGTDTAINTITVFPNTLTAFFNTDTTFGCSPLTVHCTNYSSPHALHHTWAIIYNNDTLKHIGENLTHTFSNLSNRTDTAFLQLWIDDNCSRDTAYSEIIIYPQPQLNFGMSDTEICAGEKVFFENLSQVADFYWEFGDGETCLPSSSIVEHIYKSPGNYSVSLIGRSVDFGCWDTVQKALHVLQTPSAFIETESTVGCVPFTINLNADSSFNQLWDYGDQSPVTTNQQHTYLQPGLFTINMVSEYQNLCTDTSYLQIRVLPKPKSNFSVNSLGGYPEKVQFINESEGFMFCEWILPNGESRKDCDFIEFDFETIGKYIITLITTNDYGCQDSMSVSHEVFFKGLFIPNAFTPNNLTSEISTFKAVGIGLYSFHLEIYDTYGNLIWQTDKISETKPLEGWDGTFKGKPLQQDVYIWKADAIFLDNSIWNGMENEKGVFQKYGTLTLIR
ncbi:MAG: PKD domain-containing protein [Bacteroidales bacterium]|nr:PKD domain-containing protein [Bacteroidales bacterium]